MDSEKAYFFGDKKTEGSWDIVIANYIHSGGADANLFVDSNMRAFEERSKKEQIKTWMRGKYI